MYYSIKTVLWFIIAILFGVFSLYSYIISNKYENIKEHMVELTNSILKQHLLPQLKEKNVVFEDTYITYVLSTSLIEGVYTILKNYDDGIKISFMIDQLINIFFTDISQRILISTI